MRYAIYLRELFIPETQEVVRPHDQFMLFATQIPPGLYGGRKSLSLAFRNRFLELHVDDIPGAHLATLIAGSVVSGLYITLPAHSSSHSAPMCCRSCPRSAPELEEILLKRCLIAPKFCKRMVSVMMDLQKRRQRSQVGDTSATGPAPCSGTTDRKH